MGPGETGGKQKRVWGRIRAAIRTWVSGSVRQRARVGAAPVGPGSCARVPPSDLGEQPAGLGRSPDARPASMSLSLLSCGAQAPAPLFLEPWVSWAATHLLEAQKPHLGLGILNAPHRPQRQNSPHPLSSGTFSSLFNYDFQNSLLRRTVPSPKQNLTFPYPQGSAF